MSASQGPPWSPRPLWLTEPHQDGWWPLGGWITPHHVVTCLPTDPPLWAQSRLLGLCYGPEESHHSTAPAQWPPQPDLASEPPVPNKPKEMPSLAPWTAALTRAPDPGSVGLHVFSKLLWVTSGRRARSSTGHHPRCSFPSALVPLHGSGAQHLRLRGAQQKQKHH